MTNVEKSNNGIALNSDVKNSYEVEMAGDTAVLKYKDIEAFYESTDISKKQLKEVFKYADEYIAKATAIGAEASTALMAENKDINKVVVEFPYGVSTKGKVEVLAKREHTYPGVNGSQPVKKSTLKVAVKDPYTKATKALVKRLESVMTKELLGISLESK